MDLTKLSNDDLKALADGNISAMSTEGLQFIAGSQQEPEGAISRVMRTARESPSELLEPFPRGVAEGMFVEPVLGLSQLVTRGLGMGETALDRYITQREQRIEETPGMESGRFAGLFLSPAAGPLSRVPSLVSRTPAVGGSRVFQSAVTGGSAAALTPVTTEGDFAEQKPCKQGLVLLLAQLWILPCLPWLVWAHQKVLMLLHCKGLVWTYLGLRLGSSLAV